MTTHIFVITKWAQVFFVIVHVLAQLLTLKKIRLQKINGREYEQI